jgi:hypothetical protein
VIIAGTIIFLLGALWLLQGLGLVTMAPILCFAGCAPIKGPAPIWTMIGAVAIVLGVFLLWRFGFKQSRHG